METTRSVGAHAFSMPDRDVPAQDNHSEGQNASDLEALLLARTDPRAFAPIYERYALPIYYFCFRRLGNAEDASDLTSAVFVRAIGAMGSFRPRQFHTGSTVRAWLYTIARNMLIDQHRRNRPTDSLNHPAAPELQDPAWGPEAVALGAEEARLVAHLLDGLPEPRRTIVELRLAGLSIAEIAQTLGMSVPSVKAHQVRAYRTLRERIVATPHLISRERP